MCKLRGIIWYVIHANRMLMKIWPHLTFGWLFINISLTIHPTHSKLYIFVVLITSRVIWYTWKVISSILKFRPVLDLCVTPTGKGPNCPEFCQNIFWPITTSKSSITHFRQNGTWVLSLSLRALFCHNSLAKVNTQLLIYNSLTWQDKFACYLSRVKVNNWAKNCIQQVGYSRTGENANVFGHEILMLFKITHLPLLASCIRHTNSVTFHLLNVDILSFSIMEQEAKTMLPYYTERSNIDLGAIVTRTVT